MFMNYIEENEMVTEVHREIADDGPQSINREIGKYTVS